MISVQNLSKNFGKVNALKNISFEVSQGEIIAFLGQNGAGKTTLMRILTTYLSLSSGKVFSFFPNIKNVAIRAIGIPITLETIGTVRDALGLASKI